MKYRKHLVLESNWFKDYEAQYRIVEKCKNILRKKVYCFKNCIYFRVYEWVRRIIVRVLE